MDSGLGYLAVALLACFGIAVILWSGRSRGLFTGGRDRLPRRFEVGPLGPADLPYEARRPVEFLTRKLLTLGFIQADEPTRVPALRRLGYELLIVPYVHVDEGTFFLMGIEAGFGPGAQLMLHLLTPLSGGRRVETTTLSPLTNLMRPPHVEAQVVVDAESIEEIWSRHRLALARHERSEREVVEPEAWRQHTANSYEAWLQAAVRAQKLTLESDGRMYRVRPRPKSVI